MLISRAQYNLLLSHHFIKQILAIPHENPVLFLESLESFFHIRISSDFMDAIRKDKFVIHSNAPESPKLIINSVHGVLFQAFSVREWAYLELAQIINEKNSIIRTPPPEISQEYYRQTKSLSNNIEPYRTSLKKPVGDFFKKTSISDIRRNSIKISTSEIIFPSCFYCHNDGMLFQTKYIVNNPLTFHQWEKSISSKIIPRINSVDNTISVMLEALLFSHVFKIEDTDISAKYNECFSLLIEICPNLILWFLAVRGLLFELNKQTSNSEQYYLQALSLMIKNSGDPRGRGIVPHPLSMLLASQKNTY